MKLAKTQPEEGQWGLHTKIFYIPCPRCSESHPSAPAAPGGAEGGQGGRTCVSSSAPPLQRQPASEEGQGCRCSHVHGSDLYLAAAAAAAALEKDAQQHGQQGPRAAQHATRAASLLSAATARLPVRHRQRQGCASLRGGEENARLQYSSQRWPAPVLCGVLWRRQQLSAGMCAALGCMGAQGQGPRAAAPAAATGRTKRAANQCSAAAPRQVTAQVSSSCQQQQGRADALPLAWAELTRCRWRAAPHCRARRPAGLCRQGQRRSL